jgi:hypothetical protein
MGDYAKAFRKGDKVVYLGKPCYEVNCDEFIGIIGIILNDPVNSLDSLKIQFEKKYEDDEDDVLLFSPCSVRYATDSEIYNYDNSHIKEKIVYLLSLLK